MSEPIIEKKVWNRLVELARRRGQKPERLASQVLLDYLQLQHDEGLLMRSAKAASRTSFKISESEELVKKYRSGKK